MSLWSSSRPRRRAARPVPSKESRRQANHTRNFHFSRTWLLLKPSGRWKTLHHGHHDHDITIMTSRYPTTLFHPFKHVARVLTSNNRLSSRGRLRNRGRWLWARRQRTIRVFQLWGKSAFSFHAFLGSCVRQHLLYGASVPFVIGRNWNKPREIKFHSALPALFFAETKTRQQK